MNHYDERLQQLLTVISGESHVRAALNELTAQRQALEKKVAELSYVCMDEQRDVDRLETRSLRSLVIGLLGKKEDALERERAELAAAMLKYELAKRELGAVEAQEQQRQAELNRIEQAGEEYARLLQDKADFIGRMGGSDAEEIAALRQRIARSEATCEELAEAIQAGRRAESLAELALEAMDSAEAWGTIDLVGGGLISDLAKYDRMEQARELIEQLQGQIRLFRAELADVAMDVRAEVEFDGLFRFADIFFDDIFTAFSAMDRIKRSMNSVSEVLRHIRQAIHELETRLRSEKGELSAARERLQYKVIQTKA